MIIRKQDALQKEVMRFRRRNVAEEEYYAITDHYFQWRERRCWRTLAATPGGVRREKACYWPRRVRFAPYITSSLAERAEVETMAAEAMNARSKTLRRILRAKIRIDNARDRYRGSPVTRLPRTAVIGDSRAGEQYSVWIERVHDRMAKRPGKYTRVIAV